MKVQYYCHHGMYYIIEIFINQLIKEQVKQINDNYMLFFQLSFKIIFFLIMQMNDSTFNYQYPIILFIPFGHIKNLLFINQFKKAVLYLLFYLLLCSIQIYMVFVSICLQVLSALRDLINCFTLIFQIIMRVILSIKTTCG